MSRRACMDAAVPDQLRALEQQPGDESAEAVAKRKKKKEKKAKTAEGGENAAPVPAGDKHVEATNGAATPAPEAEAGAEEEEESGAVDPAEVFSCTHAPTQFLYFACPALQCSAFVNSGACIAIGGCQPRTLSVLGPEPACYALNILGGNSRIIMCCLQAAS